MRNFISSHPALFLIFFVNMLSFAVTRFCWATTGKTGAELEVIRPIADGKKMYYLVAGCVNQPRSAFRFLIDELKDGGVTFVNYQAVRGCNIESIAEQVIADAKEHRYDVRVIGISIGDYVGREVEAQIPNAKSVGINPEPEASVLRPYANIASKVGSVLLEVLTVPLGWLSAIPWYSDCGNRFSTAFIADQFVDIGFARASYVTGNTEGIIISQRPGKAEGDEFLSNQAISEYFSGVPIAEARTGHGNTVGGADEFLAAWRELDLTDF